MTRASSGRAALTTDRSGVSTVNSMRLLKVIRSGRKYVLSS